MRKKTVAGNWKMNMNYTEAKALFNSILAFEIPSDTEVIIAPPFIYLSEFSCENQKGLKLAGQNCASQTNGAYTGEISAEMLSSIGVEYCLVGHSERRSYFNETEKEFVEKIQLLLDQEISPIYCVGETLSDRDSGNAFAVVKQQIEGALFNFENIAGIVLAYEPVWAIGTGKTASAEQAQEMHAFIRTLISNKFGENVAEQISILYGGSVKPANAVELFSKPDIDGGLIGGAALSSESFQSLINS